MVALEKMLIPLPKRVKDGKEAAVLAKGAEILFSLKVEGNDPLASEGAELLRKKVLPQVLGGVFPENAGAAITVTVRADDPMFSDITAAESYYIRANGDGVLLCGKDGAGAFYACVTFSQMLFASEGNLCFRVGEILDYPDFPHRGQFSECRYGSEFMTLEDWYRFIDYLAEMKNNRLNIGIYGCWSIQYDDQRAEYLYVPLKKYPQLKTPKNIKYYSVKERAWVDEENLLPTMFREDYFGKIVAYGKKRNVTVSPRINSLGHNTLLPRSLPDTAPVTEGGEKGGFGFCTRSDATFELMFDFYDEVIDRYLAPYGVTEINIGLDEVGAAAICHCPKCKDLSLADAMVEYLIKLCRHLKEKGMTRVMMCHDMLYHRFNIVNEDLKKKLVDAGVYDVVVLDWWSYDDPVNLFWGKADGVNNIFRGIIKPYTGYYHWVIPTESNENIRACVKMAKRLGFEGVEPYGIVEDCFDKNFLTSADLSWNADNCDREDDFDERYATRLYPGNVVKAQKAFKHLSTIMKDETRELYMNRACYKLEYYFYCYRRGNPPSINPFPDAVYKMIGEKEEVWIPYLNFLKEHAVPAAEFFAANGEHSHMNDVWLLTSKHYVVLADEYLSLWNLSKKYEKEKLDPGIVMRELTRLITQREELMKLAEDTRFAATAYTYLRNMSVFRQYLIDLRDYFRRESAAGRRPVFDLCDLSATHGDTIANLR